MQYIKKGSRISYGLNHMLSKKSRSSILQAVSYMQGINKKGGFSKVGAKFNIKRQRQDQTGVSHMQCKLSQDIDKMVSLWGKVYDIFKKMS